MAAKLLVTHTQKNTVQTVFFKIARPCFAAEGCDATVLKQLAAAGNIPIFYSTGSNPQYLGVGQFRNFGVA